MGDLLRSIAVPLDHVRPSDPDEAALVRELQAGAEDAFAHLLALYRNPVYNMVYHITDNEADAADVLQNVFVKIIRGIKTFRRTSSLKTWIYRIAVREALNYRRGWFRRSRREVASVDDLRCFLPVAQRLGGAERETPYDWVEQVERKDMIERALRSLPESYRAVVVLREVEDLSYDEISNVLGIAEGTVKSRLKRGREMLRRKLAGCVVLQGY